MIQRSGPRSSRRLLESKNEGYIYINPNAPAEVKDLVAEHFSDVSRVSSVFMQEVTGGFMDEGPPLSAYAAALLDEEGELHLLEPVIP